MATPVQRVTSDGVHFDFAGLKANEMVQVQKWTGIDKRRDFYRAILAEDPAAVLAAFSLVKWRESGELPRWGDVAVNLDDLDSSLHIDGRDVVMQYEKDDDGDVLLVCVDSLGRPRRNDDGAYVTPTGADGETVGVVALRDASGELLYHYADTDEPVTPTTATSTTSGSTDSPSTDATPSPTDCASGTQTTNES